MAIKVNENAFMKVNANPNITKNMVHSAEMYGFFMAMSTDIKDMEKTKMFKISDMIKK
jgi:hypothetical protein